MYILCRQFVAGFAKFAASLSRKPGKGEPFQLEVLTDTDFEAFRHLKEKLL